MLNVHLTNVSAQGPREKTSLGESLTGSHAYNPIRDSRQQSRRESRQESCRDLIESNREFYCNNTVLIFKNAEHDCIYPKNCNCMRVVG